MEKRMMLAIVLSIAIMFSWTYLFQDKTKPVKIEEKKVEKIINSSPTKDRFNKNPAEETLTKDISSINTQNLEKKEVELENQLIKIVFSNQGGIIKNISLKKYNDNSDENIKLLDLKDNNFYPLGIFSSNKPLNTLMNFSIWDIETQNINNKSIVRFNLILSNVNQDQKVPYLKITKEFSLDENSYLVSVNLKFTNLLNSNQTISEHKLLWEPLLESSEQEKKEKDIVTYTENKVNHRTVSKIKNSETFLITTNITKEKNINWISTANKYFVATLIPGKNINSLLIDKTGNDENSVYNIGLVMNEKKLLPNEEIIESAEIYIGPKEFEKLKALDIKLEENINFGFFGIMSKGLLIALRYFNKLFSNYGIAIILITIIIKILFMPLTEKSFTSMKKMHRLQVDIDLLKQKYKNDTQRFNAEVMQLYKEKGVNPMSGCLPMIVQIPIFLAFYNTLNTAIELRQAPFMWWIKDLSKPDTIYHIGSIAINILPIFMLISMVIQQKMSTHKNPNSSKDEQFQQKFLLFGLPIVFGVMFYKMPSGLVLYWFLNNILSIIHQYFINKKVELQS